MILLLLMVSKAEVIMKTGTGIKNQVPEGLRGGEYVYSGDDDKRILYADANVIRLFECDDFEDLLNYTDGSFCNMLHPDDYAEAQRAIGTQTDESGHRHGYLRYRIVTKTGSIRYTESFGHNVVSDDGRVYYYVFIAEIDKDEYYKEYYNSFAEGQIDAMNWKLDHLTGLMNLSVFREELDDDSFHSPDDICTVAVFDIIGMHKINLEEGRIEGDKRIRTLVKSVLVHMPADCSVYRGYDAEIIAVCWGKTEQELMDQINDVVRNGGSRIVYAIASNKEKAVCSENSSEEKSVYAAIEEAQFALNAKKMLTVSSSRSQTLTSLVRALEEVDQDTEEHVLRTRRTGTALGRRLGLGDAQLAKLELLCLLHDIGKIAIPLDILNKPGKLNADEWKVLRSHPDKGYLIAMSSNELSPIADCIRYHHERWDGKGYPCGLAGEDIPVLSRIIAVVDAYDAMVNDRCYRKAMSPESAMKEITDNAGTQFDPVMARAFVQMLREDPELSLGKKTGAGEVRVFKRTDEHIVGLKNTQPIDFCEYKLDIDDIIIEVGDSFESLTGYSPEDVIGKLSQFDLIPKEDLEDYIQQVCNQFARSDTALLRHRIQRKDGMYITVICHGSRKFNSATRTFISKIQIYEV